MTLQQDLSTDSNVTRREPCPSCVEQGGDTKGDNLARYDDGHGHCFACGYHETTTDGDRSGELLAIELPERSSLLSGSISSLRLRGLTEDTCRRFQYLCGEDRNGNPIQIAQYRDRNGRISAQKLRYQDKRGFPWVGDPKSVRLFGSHLYGSGKKLVVTEGELDAMSVSQVQNHKWPVVSLINGASGAVKDFQKNLDYLSQFEEVILFFDMDEPGQTAAVEVCKRFGTTLNIKVAQLPLKDANDMVKAERGAEIINAIWNATPYRPEGLVEASTLLEEFLKEDSYDKAGYPYPSLDAFLHGLRTSELVCVTAGTGTGKSAFVREIVYGLHRAGECVGVLMLEESIKRTLEGLVGIHINRPIHTSRESISADELRKSFVDLFNRPLYLLDHFGSTNVDDLLGKIVFMVKSLGCKWIILDHLSIVVSGIEGDERRGIDEIMTRLRTLCQEAKVGIILVSHLRRNTGSSDDTHERGAEITLAHLRGSHSIAQLSDIVIALERDQQSETSRNLTTVRVIKNRFTGETGVVCTLKWFSDTGRLLEFAKEFKDGKSSAGATGQDEKAASTF